MSKERSTRNSGDDGLGSRGSRGAQQFAISGRQAPAVGAGLQALADLADIARAFADFGRDLVPADAKAGADDRPDILARSRRPPREQRHPRVRRQIGSSANRPVSQERDTSVWSGATNTQPSSRPSRTAA